MSMSTASIIISLCAVVLFRVDGVRGSICRLPVCEYDFVVSRVETMTYVHPTGKTFDVELNGSRLVVAPNNFRTEEEFPEVIGMTVDRRHVITADGYPRDVIVVNGQFPGPTIEVMEGSQIVVRVHNHLLNEVTTIHWHGIRMQDNYYMDGVPYVTQCPILPRQTFTYWFQAYPAGTHWYHSHHGNQRLDGLYGMLIIHRWTDDPPPSHSIFVTDWYHMDSNALATRIGSVQQPSFTGETMRHYHSQDRAELSRTTYVSALLGGRGRYDGRVFPLEVYPLTFGLRHLFRLVNAGAEFSFEISADDHVIDIVAMDGYDLQPIRADAAILHPGESLDFELLADRSEFSRYWLRAEPLLAGIGPDVTQEGVAPQEARAILEYAGGLGDADPSSRPRNCTASDPCVVFNCPFPNYPAGSNKSCRHAYQARSRQTSLRLRLDYGLFDRYPEEYFLNFAFVGAMTVNGRRFVPPRGFRTSRLDSWKYVVPCDEEACRGKWCSCTNTLSIPHGATVQMVLTNYKSPTDVKAPYMHHSVHMHGHGFAVLATGFGEWNSTSGQLVGPNEDITCDSNVCSQPRWTGATPELNLIDPPVKDTIIVPAEGYVVVRFRSDNPGLWLMHCHQETHNLDGMALLLDVGSREVKPDPPDGFPTCGDFNWTNTRPRMYPTMLSREQEHSKGEKSVSAEANSIINETTTPEDKDLLQIPRGKAIGGAIMFMLLGAFLATVPLVIKLLHSNRRKTQTQRSLEDITEETSLLGPQ